MKRPSKRCMTKRQFFEVDEHYYVLGDLEPTAGCIRHLHEPHRQIFEALEALVKGWS